MRMPNSNQAWSSHFNGEDEQVTSLVACQWHAAVVIHLRLRSSSLGDCRQAAVVLAITHKERQACIASSGCARFPTHATCGTR